MSKLLPNTNDITILNYPGSKKRLLPFISEVVGRYAKNGDTVMDIFAGTHSVGYYLKPRYSIIANDSEIYSYVIGKALIENKRFLKFNDIQAKFLADYNKNLHALRKYYPEVTKEEELIATNQRSALLAFYDGFPNVWQKNYKKRRLPQGTFSLFTTYYSNSYFGLAQSMEIDSIRAAIDKLEGKESFYYLLTALFFALKECVFAKDGHMAQPLNKAKNLNRLLKTHKESVFERFMCKVKEFESRGQFSPSINTNKVFNLPLKQILEKDILRIVDLIYADPPYTDMQYSRYFHLLETLVRYDYPKFALSHGKITTGLYRDNRFQSPLSQRSNAKRDIEQLIKRAAELGKKVIFSYAYPVDLKKQKSDRYTMSIDDLIGMYHAYYGKKHTIVEKQLFSHCNNRNSAPKKVYEYLIVGLPYAK